MNDAINNDEGADYDAYLDSFREDYTEKDRADALEYEESLRDAEALNDRSES